MKSNNKKVLNVSDDNLPNLKHLDEDNIKASE